MNLRATLLLSLIAGAASACALEAPELSEAFLAGHTIYLDFDGAWVESAQVDDSRTEPVHSAVDGLETLGQVYVAPMEVAALGPNAAELIRIETDKHFAGMGFDVEVVTTRPTSGDYRTAIIGNINPLLSTWYRALGTLGITPVEDCAQDNRNAVVFVSSNSVIDEFASLHGVTDPATLRMGIAHVIAHEFGHTFGFDHDDDPESIMFPFTVPGQIERATWKESFVLAPNEDCRYSQTGKVSWNNYFWCDGADPCDLSFQNAYVVLLDYFGARPGSGLSLTATCGDDPIGRTRCDPATPDVQYSCRWQGGATGWVAQDCPTLTTCTETAGTPGGRCLPPLDDNHQPPATPTTLHVTLRSHGDALTGTPPQYLAAELGGGDAVHANREEASVWEHFKLTDENGGQLTDGDIVTFGTSGGYFLTNQNQYLTAVATAVGDSERFIVHRVTSSGSELVADGDEIALKSVTNQKLLAAEGGGGGANSHNPAGAVTINRSAIGSWETFTISYLP